MRSFGRMLVLAVVVLACAIPAFSQEEKAGAAPAAEMAAMSKDIAIYGEVRSVNASSGSLTVIYYDEESYEEKTIDLVTDKATKIESAPALSGIREGDWVDATYTTKDGKNVATLIKLETEEEEAETPETAPAEMPEEE
ncbi:MAG: hypothetical protein JW919_02660 [Candidatus Omnitrophica bacterium]|nr:hypothetical protein [Candidatus Omnitrophota bacterium]